jgi:hypothetical protein
MVDGGKEDADDYLDYLGEQVERLLFHEWELFRKLPDYDPTGDTEGLTLGSALLSTKPYHVNTESGRRVAAQDLTFALPYRSATYLDKRLSDFNSYKADIIKVGADETTTDPVLISAEGEF